MWSIINHLGNCSVEGGRKAYSKKEFVIDFQSLKRFSGTSDSESCGERKTWPSATTPL
jgi:hypothetical protein